MPDFQRQSLQQSHAVRIDAALGEAVNDALAAVPQRCHTKVLATKKKTAWLRGSCGSPNGIRTRVTAVRGRRPRPLDDRAKKKTPGAGLEPTLRTSEAPRLPLTDPGLVFSIIRNEISDRFSFRLRAPYVSVWLWQFGQSIRRFSTRWSSLTPFRWSIWMTSGLPLHSEIPHSSH